MRMKTTIWLNYIDKLETGENAGLVIYVGKGNKARIKNPQRNKKHKAIANKYGIIREIVFTTTDEKTAYQEEIRLISELHTSHKDPLASKYACNFQPGGQGFTSDLATKFNNDRVEKNSHPFTGGAYLRKYWAQFTPEERSQMLSERNLKQWASLTDEEYKERCKNAHRNTGYNHTPEAKLAIKIGNKGKKKPGTSKGLMGNTHTLGFKHTSETRKQTSNSIKKWWALRRKNEGRSQPGDEIYF